MIIPMAMPATTDNDQLADDFDEIGSLLEAQGANPFRVKAYRTAAQTIRRLPKPVKQILADEGLNGLMQLPGIGNSLAHAIEHFIHTSRVPLLDRLRGDDMAVRLFTSVPEIGPKLATQIHEELGIETLKELETTAMDGRLGQVRGMGPKRLQAVRETLAGRRLIGNGRGKNDSLTAGIQERAFNADKLQSSIPVGELLDVDEQYRKLADQGELPRIAPRSFNPSGQAWLPILHTDRRDRHYTALFSNTSRAHELGMTHDWVVIYGDDPNDHGRWTVITANYGNLKGRRIVCGRELECEIHYADKDIS